MKQLKHRTIFVLIFTLLLALGYLPELCAAFGL